jgi:hypothetical protein
MLSVQIPVIWAKRLEEVLISISHGSDEIEIVIVDSTGREIVRELGEKYNAKVVEGSIESFCKALKIRELNWVGPEPERLGLLAARYLAHLNSSGDRALLLDETRLLTKSAINKLNLISDDMAVIPEVEIGEGYWSRMANLDKITVLDQNRDRFEPVYGFILPRFFKSTVLTEAFNVLYSSIPLNVFISIVQLDHQLLYTEAYRISKNVSFVDEPLIRHYGDETLKTLLKKYYRYGKSDRIKTRLPKKYVLDPKKRLRRVHGLHNIVNLLPLYAARGLSYLAGYYLGL